MKRIILALSTALLLIGVNITNVSAKSYKDLDEMAEDLIIEIFSRQDGSGKFQDFKFVEDDYELIPYEEIMREREGLVDVKHQFFAEVQQYEEITDIDIGEGLFMRDGDLDRAYYFIIPNLPDKRLMKNDKVDVYGTLKGLVTYETVIGGSKTVPVILVEKILIEGIDY